MSRLPTDFPVADIGLIVRKLRGDTEVANKVAAESAWWLVGYGLNIAMPTAIAGNMAWLPAVLDDEALAAKLEESIAMHTPDSQGGAGLAILTLLLPLLVDLAKRWLLK